MNVSQMRRDTRATVIGHVDSKDRLLWY